MLAPHKSAAWPLAWVYAVLVVYASLYPFAEWRDQGVQPWAFLSAPWPRYWARFDVAINVVGYIPLGGLLALGVLRSQRRYGALVFSVLMASLLSLAMEGVQNYLPARVASREDWVLNTFGAGCGAVLAGALWRWGLVDRWSRWRARWFVTHARGAMVLLALWPWALLYPAAIPLGLGRVMGRLEAWLAEALQHTPFLAWLPVREAVLLPLAPGLGMLCVLLGLLIPCLLGYCVVRSPGRRILLALGLAGLGLAATALSAALSWGPAHAWAWLDMPSKVGFLGGVVAAVLLVAIPWRVSAALVLLAVGAYLSLLHQAPAGPYFAHTLHAWEQGRFIRFHGVSQWLGWLWPYAAVLYALSLLWRRDGQN